MESIIKVPNLLKLTADAVVKGTVEKFSALFPDKVVTASVSPPRKKPKMDEVTRRKAEERDREIKSILDLMDSYLIGPAFFELRQLIVDRFIEHHIINHNLTPEHGLAFFACLLDDTFKKLDLTVGDGNHPFKMMDPVELISVITERCPYLQVLKLWFGSDSNHVPFVSSFGKLLKALRNLTKLSLTWICPDDYGFDYFFTWLGTDLPGLTSLEIGGTIPLRIQELLKLMLGKKEELIPKATKILMCTTQKSELQHIEFTPESLTPICHNLTELKVNFNQKKQNRHVAILAFVLRNFRQLKNFPQSPLLVSLTLNKLRERQLEPLDKFNPRTESMTSRDLGTVRWTLDAPFVGKYLLHLHLLIASFEF
jgi:hypothetical protein